MEKTVAVIGASFRPLLEARLPEWVDARWFSGPEELAALAPEIEIGWLDGGGTELPAIIEAMHAARNAKWFTTMGAGVDPYPLAMLAERGVTLTNGAGLHSAAVAEYALLGVLSIAKGFREVLRAQDRREWLHEPPRKIVIAGSKALVIGAGEIGGHIADLLRAFGAEVVTVRSRAVDGALGPDEWRARLGEFDWVIVIVPSTGDTAKLLGPAEFAAMKRGAAVVNIARGAVLDQDALMAALDSGQVGAAFLDVTDPEPLPADHPLWTYDNVQISMHLSGRSQDTLPVRAVERFLGNLDRYGKGEPMHHVVDLKAGY